MFAAVVLPTTTTRWGPRELGSIAPMATGWELMGASAASPHRPQLPCLRRGTPTLRHFTPLPFTHIHTTLQRHSCTTLPLLRTGGTYCTTTTLWLSTTRTITMSPPLQISQHPSLATGVKRHIATQFGSGNIRRRKYPNA